MRALVIGSGIAGIATAIRLKSKGYEVTVFESSEEPGGKISELKMNGFRFDLGPSLFTLPELVDELFDLFPEYKSDFEYSRLKSICKYYWEDGKNVQAVSDTEQFATNLETEFGVEKKTTLNYLKHCNHLYKLTAPTFLNKSLHKWNTWISPDVIKPILSISKLNLFRTLSEVNQDYFAEPHVRQLFNRYATYNGSSPFLTPGIMQIIPHLEYNLGAYFPKKGMRQIILSLVELAKHAGVEFRCGEKVKNIIVCNGTAKGIELKDEVVKGDLVISNSDIFNTNTKLLKKRHVNNISKNAERSSSGMIFYLGIKGTHDQLNLHNILFSNDYKDEFNSIFNKKKISSDPTIYIHISSKINESDAPANSENWFVMVNAPVNNGQDWEVEKKQTREHIINKINRTLKIDIREKIITEECFTPADIEERTGSHKGALYGTSSNSKFAAFLRHPNFSKKVKNLFHVGGSVHPGGGIPLCLNSAKIASSLIPNCHVEAN